MNVIKRICLLIACGVLLMSCAQSGMQDDGLYGYLTLDVTDDLKDLVQMKSSSSGQLVYRVDIYDSDEVLVKSFADHNEAMAQPIPLLMDRYKVHAINGEYKTAFNAPCFDDQENVRVYPEKPASVDLVCNLSQVKFSVHFPEDDDFKNSFSKYELIVSNGTDELIFSSAPVAENPTYGGFADTAYLKVPEDGILKYTLSMLNKDGAHYSSVAQIESVGRAEHYHLDFKVGEREDIEGALVLDILLDGEFSQQIEHDVMLNFDKTRMPSYTVNAEFDPSTAIYPYENVTPKVFTFTAERGIRHLYIYHLDSDLLEVGLPQNVDLVGATAEEIAILSGLGIKANALTAGAVSAEIDITGFVGTLPVCETGQTYSLSLSLIDEYDRFTACDMEFAIVSDIAAETGTVFPWSSFAILKGRYFTSTAPDGLTFQYKKKSDDETSWVEVDKSLIEVNPSDYTFSCLLNGLAVNTEYVFRATSDKDKLDGKTATSVSFRTFASEGTLYNLSFDDWMMGDGSNYRYSRGESSYSKNAHFPTSSLSNFVWDTANGGTASLGSLGGNPTTPESNIVVSGKAARLESQEIASNFAAGNIYTGHFGKATLSPVGAQLDWGYPFESRPLALRGWFRYEPKAINKGSYVPHGQPDICQIQIFLTNWNKVFEIDTGTKTFVDVSEKNQSIIAYGVHYCNENTTQKPGNRNGYIEFTIPLEYRNMNQPKYIVISGAASRYGDYFTGGLGSVLYLDEFELIYDPSELPEGMLDKVMSKVL